MTRYPTHSWPSAVASFRDDASIGPSFAALADGVAQIAGSRYATGLYPVQSMHTLLLFQHDCANSFEDEHLALETDGTALVLQYHPGRLPDRPAALRTSEPVWTKHGTDAIALLERALHHLRWFVEYRASAV
jgi:hypothetical protein